MNTDSYIPDLFSGEFYAFLLDGKPYKGFYHSLKYLEVCGFNTEEGVLYLRLLIKDYFDALKAIEGIPI